MSEDFYGLLGLSRDCTAQEIKQAFKKQARQFHPDNKETGDENLFKQLNEAYSVLSDPEKKAYYDRVGHQAYVSGGRGSAGAGYAGGEEIFDDLEKVFDTFFGGGGFSQNKRRGRQAQRGEDLQATLEIDFLEAVFGLEKTLEMARLINCQACTGTGSEPGHPPKACTSCNGQGEIRRTSRSFIGTITQVQTCPSCQGEGKIVSKPCNGCSGRGRKKESSQLEIKIPKGIEHGTRLLWQGRGNEGAQAGPAGDLYVLVRVKPHSSFKRDGLNILEEREVSVWQAIMGDSISIPTVHGEENLEIKSGTQQGATIKLSGSGIKLDNGRAGDHLVKVDLRIPHKADLPKELREMLESMVHGEGKSGPSLFENLFGRGKNTK